MNVMQVLIVCPNQAESTMIAEAVVASGHRGAQAQDGKEALSFVQQNKVDLILIDISLPGPNGFEVTKSIRTNNAEDWFPIILIATKTDAEIIKRSVKAGANKVLIKPLVPEDLQWHIAAFEPTFLLRKKLQAAQTGLIKLSDTLKFLSMFDQLTGLANRRNFDDTLRREFKLAQRDKLPLSLLKCDIDHFKSFNEKYGQKAGDECLSMVASVISAVCKRPTDLVCRYEADTFAVILPNTDNKGLQDICKIINKSLEKRNIPNENSRFSTQVTLSIGTANFEGQFNYVHEFTSALDESLKKAKQQGLQSPSPAALN